jgi:hypothetical protein
MLSHTKELRYSPLLPPRMDQMEVDDSLEQLTVEWRGEEILDATTPSLQPSNLSQIANEKPVVHGAHPSEELRGKARAQQAQADSVPASKCFLCRLCARSSASPEDRGANSEVFSVPSEGKHKMKLG